MRESWRRIVCQPFSFNKTGVTRKPHLFLHYINYRSLLNFFEVSVLDIVCTIRLSAIVRLSTTNGALCYVGNPLCSFDNRKKALLVFPMNTLNISIVFLRILSLRCGARFWYRRPV